MKMPSLKKLRVCSELKIAYDSQNSPLKDVRMIGDTKKVYEEFGYANEEEDT